MCPRASRRKKHRIKDGDTHYRNSHVEFWRTLNPQKKKKKMDAERQQLTG
jgi:hypothetical protein